MMVSIPAASKWLWPTGLSLFFLASTVICATAAFTLAVPGTAVDSVWSIKPRAYEELLGYRELSAPMFALLAIAMAFASYGTFHRRRWGWLLACLLFAGNGIGDAVQLATGGLLQGVIGVSVVTVLLFALFRPSVRGLFSH